MICRKCDQGGSITIKKDYTYCEICYILYLNHKFRACIGKSKVITPNEKVLIGLSGGLGSTALLDLVHTGTTLNTHKKLRLDPIFVHLTDDGNNNVAPILVEQCKNYGFQLQIYNISNYISRDIATSQITINDFNSKIIFNILACVAKELKCQLIFSAESATNLAAKLLSDIVIGRGSQIENDIGFADNRHEDTKILKPLRDITSEELQQYLKIKGLVPACTHNEYNNLQVVTHSFVSNLEKESPATISTICKTADKIGSYDSNCENGRTCKLCKSKLNTGSLKLTAVQATVFSRMVSNRNKAHEPDIDVVGNAEQEEITDQSLFPFLHQDLCYCCSKSFAEMDDLKLKTYIKNLIAEN